LKLHFSAVKGEAYRRDLHREKGEKKEAVKKILEGMMNKIENPCVLREGRASD